MASMAPYSRGRAMAVEKIVAKRRNQEEIMRQRWENHWNYLQRQSVQSSKQAAWSTAQPSSRAVRNYSRLRTEREQEEKKQRLEERRSRLRVLLEEEQHRYEQELRESTPDTLTHMKSRVDQLRGQRQKREKELAEEKCAEHWRANCPELRQAESRQREKTMPSSWNEQITHRAKQEESSRRENERYEQEKEEERKRALRLEEEQRRKQQSEGRNHAEVLQRQMMAVKAREAEAVQLEAEQARIAREQSELHTAEEERLRLEEAAKKAELGRMLTRQAKAQLRRKSQRVQEALELDLKILEDMAQKEALERGLETARRERARRDASWMKQVVADQLRLEREREAELDILHKEEAARVWESREREWRREREARERLMNEVMEERQIQLQAKMESLQLQQEESIQQREQLLREIEETSAQTAREVQSRREGKTSRAEELQAQVEEKRRQAGRVREQYERELAEQRRMEEEYDALVKREEQNIMARDPQPKSYRRRKHAW